MPAAVTDTHAILWFLFDDPRLSAVARAFIEDEITAGNQIGVSAITPAEIIYLVEKRRVQPDAFERVVEIVERDGPIVEIPVDHQIVRAMLSTPRSIVPDMPDRIIAATALYLDVPLISRDGKIRLSSVRTIWSWWVAR